MDTVVNYMLHPLKLGKCRLFSTKNVRMSVAYPVGSQELKGKASGHFEQLQGQMSSWRMPGFGATWRVAENKWTSVGNQPKGWVLMVKTSEDPVKICTVFLKCFFYFNFYYITSFVLALPETSVGHTSTSPCSKNLAI